MSYRTDDILSYREMCNTESVQTLQRGTNYRLNPNYSVILMSQKNNAPYRDKIHKDGKTIEYEGHDVPKNDYSHNPKLEDQQAQMPSGTLTQNGKFIEAAQRYRNGSRPELVKIYEKVHSGVWLFKGFFELRDFKIVNDGTRNVYRFILTLTGGILEENLTHPSSEINTRVIPSSVIQEVWKRDRGACQLCGSKENIHYDHYLPFSRGGSSLTVKNIRILCAKCNLRKSDKIE